MIEALVIVTIASLTRSDISVAVIGLGKPTALSTCSQFSTGYIPDSIVLLSQEV